jgi:uncharacterized protein YecE (DUF72 family)
MDERFAMRPVRIRIGCSGWQYRHWAGTFYPRTLSRTQWLEYYAQHFDTVEVNNTFYRLPGEGTLASWLPAVPSRFLFAIKASRFLTHMKKLLDPADPLDRLFTRTAELGRRLGPVLYQLPPQLRKDIDRLNRFLALLPRGMKHAIEFRHPSWYSEDVLTALSRARVTLCLHDMEGSAPGRLSIGPFRYVRFHGASAKYAGAYTAEQLAEWADWLVGEAKPAFVYFNNDIGGQAPRDAAVLRGLVSAASATSLR